MITRFFVQLSYKGTNYHGWQIQPNSITVQEIINDALSTIFQEKIETTGAGRTDTGVHADYFIAHFDSKKLKKADEKILYRLNQFLPTDIAIQKIIPVKKDAHARYDAISRTYRYFITKVKDPFRIDLAYFNSFPFDIRKMNSASKLLFRYDDYTSFSKLHTDVKTNKCILQEAFWEETGNSLIFTIKANRFLRNMVRAIVGTLLETGNNKLSEKDLSAILESKNRSEARTSAPAHGLFLTDIEYPAVYNLK